MTASLTPEYLREQREQPTVLKTKLSALRERHPCVLVLVLEGPEDLPVYEAWVKRLFPDLLWEPLVANGKKKSLDFFDVLERDATGVGVCTYFILDNDYDGMKGRAESPRVYMLPGYSVENFLVTEGVLDSVLRSEFQIVADPDARLKIVEVYRKLRIQFFDGLRPVGAKLFGAKNEKVGNVVVGEGVMACFNVNLIQAQIADHPKLQGLVRTDESVSAKGINDGTEFLASNDPAYWTRGKYLWAFYKFFLQLLYEDRRSETPVLFQSTGTQAEAGSSTDFAVLAARSEIPAGLRDILAKWTEECRLECGQRAA